MTESTSVRHGWPCPRCGATVSGRYCRQCGTATAAVAPLARVASNERLFWFGAGAITMALFGAVLLAVRSAPPVRDPEIPPSRATSSDAAGTPPDISNLSPRERFDRLFNRVMRAAENGDEATVTSFAPMALGAYAMLDSIDADARYHAALIDLHTGNIAGASALADSILTREPGHLFGYVVRGTIARFQRNDAVLREAYRDFLKAYPAEQRRARPEYQDHPKALEDFHAAATAALR